MSLFIGIVSLFNITDRLFQLAIPKKFHVAVIDSCGYSSVPIGGL